MSSLDIILIPSTVFKEVQKRLEVPEKIRQVYNVLLAEYDCFTKPEIMSTRYFNQTKHGKTQHHNTHDSNKKPHFYNTFKNVQFNRKHSLSHTRISEKPNIFKFKNDPADKVKRELQGYLNIINTNNFPKVSKKIAHLLIRDKTKTNIKAVFDTILDTACMQVFYVTIFYDLLCNLLNVLGEDDKDYGMDVINHFIDNFITSKDYILQEKETFLSNETNYAFFCIQQKHKTVSTSKNLVILELLKHDHSVKWDVKTYCDTLISELSYLNSLEPTDELDNPYGKFNPFNLLTMIHGNDGYTYSDMKDSQKQYNTDILLTLLKDIKSMFKHVSFDFTKVKELPKHSYDQRIRFMINDIIA